MKRIQMLVLASLILGLLLSGCQPGWQLTLQLPDGHSNTVDYQVFEQLGAFVEQPDGEAQLPLERILAESGYMLVEELVIVDQQGQPLTYDWFEIAGQSWLLENGHLRIQDDEIKPGALQIEVSPELTQANASILDIAPTVSNALSLPTPELATGSVFKDLPAEHVLLLYLDGFGYLRYQAALQDGSIPFLASLDSPLMALSVYPPITVAASAALLTGAPPAVNGVNMSGIRKTETETIFDVAAGEGLMVQAVEGNAIAFQLRNAEFQLSGDRDGDGSTDDNVLANTLGVLQTGMPDLFFVHFHGIDDAGHEYGPRTPMETAALQRIDAAVAEIIQALPEGTLIIIFADHGMHQVIENGIAGNIENDHESGDHGYLIPEDMLIPIFILKN